MLTNGPFALRLRQISPPENKITHLSAQPGVFRHEGFFGLCPRRKNNNACDEVSNTWSF